jgi:hypoxanthine phosphoribosyltransferase
MKIKQIHVHFTEEQIEARIREIGEAISRDYGDESVTLVCILKGSAIFTCELAKRISSPVELEFMSVSSYGSGTSSSGVVRIVHDLDSSIEGKNVIVIEDIIDSGRTLGYLLENLKTRNPKSLKLCTLLDKPDRRVVDVPVDYVGFVIPDEFVVGYGLDYDQKYRNLPYIGFVEIEEE